MRIYFSCGEAKENQDGTYSLLGAQSNTILHPECYISEPTEHPMNQHIFIVIERPVTPEMEDETCELCFGKLSENPLPIG